MPAESTPIFYLDLNDDALIRDLLSGVCSGTPEARDIQNLYPFGTFVALLYRLIPGVPHFGIILFGLQILCAVLILLRAVSLVRDSERFAAGAVRGKRIGMLVVLLMWGILYFLSLPHFFFVQYSVTVGFLAAAAAFFFMTGQKRRHFAAGVILCGIGYVIRSEMLLLLLPLILCALLFRYAGEVRASRAENEELPGIWELIRYPFVTDHYRRFGITLVSLVLVLSACWSVDRIGYAAQEWDDFVRFFNARTQVYDYTGVPSYEGNEAFYGSAGLDAGSVMLLENYNFGLEDRIDAQAMEQIASYAAKQAAPAGSRLLQATGAYFYRLHHTGFPADYTWPQTDAPWNIMAAVLYMGVIALALLSIPRSVSMGQRLLRALWQPVLLFLCRSALWLYIITGGRDPVRITHPLYFAETAVLTGMILMRLLSDRKEVVNEEEKGQNPVRAKLAVTVTVFAVFLVVGGLYGAGTVRLIRQDQSRRQEANEPYLALRAYCRTHKDSLYVFDVYSSVAETRPLFSGDKRKGRPDNLLLAGGWAAKSPVWQDQLSSFGYDTLAEALLSEDVCFVTDAERDASWLTEYYAARGIRVTLTEEDSVTAGGRTMRILSVREVGS